MPNFEQQPIEQHKLQSVMLDDQLALALYSSFWTGRMVVELDKPNPQFGRMQQARETTEAFIAKNTSAQIFDSNRPLGIASQLDHFFMAIEWQTKQEDSANFSDLPFLGVDYRGMEVVWGDLTYLAPKYNRMRNQQTDIIQVTKTVAERISIVETVKAKMDKKLKGFCTNNGDDVEAAVAVTMRNNIMQKKQAVRLEEELQQKVEEKIAQKLNRQQENVPVSYAWLKKFESIGLITPQLQETIGLNQAIINGEQIDLYCCPNYSTEKRADGVHVYTFEELGNNIGLTAERSFPLLTNLIERTTHMTNEGKLSKPLKVRVGIADFEATDSNAELVGLSIDQFNGKLEGSVMNMVKNILTIVDSQSGDKLMEAQLIQTNDPSEKIGEYMLKLSSKGTSVAEISFGAITQNYVEKVEGYKGKETFDAMVETKRDELEALVDKNPAVHPALDNTLQVRLGLMLDWEEPEKPAAIDELKLFFDQVTDHDFHNGIHTPPHLDSLKEEVRKILVQEELAEIVKSQMVKDIMVNWMKDRAPYDTSYAEALAYLRKKIARQGAEYAVMSDLMEKAGIKAQIVADSAPMWQTFGGKKVTRVIIKGGYEGAEKDGILQQ